MRRYIRGQSVRAPQSAALLTLRRVSRKVTHLVVSANRTRTQKVRQAAKYPHIKIVNHNWLMDCLSKWQKEDEEPYIVSHTELLHASISSRHAPPNPRFVCSLDRRFSKSGSQTNTKILRRIADDFKISVSRDDRGSPEGFDTPADDSSAAEAESDSSEDDVNGEGDLTTNGNSVNGDGIEANSPIDDLKEFDWAAADDELAEFMAESGDDSDTESIASQSSVRSTPSQLSIRGPKHGLDESTDEEGDGPESHIAKKKRLANSRSTGLKKVSVQGGDDSREDAGVINVPPSPRPTDGENTDDDDLEAEMLAEFEKEEEANA